MQPQLTDEDLSSVRSQLQGFEATLKEDPNNAEALEGAAVSAAGLGDYGRAEELLTQLVQKRANDPQAWRLLAEVRCMARSPCAMYVLCFGGAQCSVCIKCSA